MERATTDNFITSDGNDKFLNALKECDGLLLQHLARRREGIDDRTNLFYITCPGWTNHNR
jgi:hypothetical protein